MYILVWSRVWNHVAILYELQNLLLYRSEEKHHDEIFDI